MTPPIIFFTGRPSRDERDGGLVGAVAVRTGAVDDEGGVVVVRGEVAFVDAAVRQVHGAIHVSFFEQLRTAHVEHHEAGLVVLQGEVHVPAIRLELQERREVRECFVRRGGGDVGDGTGYFNQGHVPSLPAGHRQVRAKWCQMWLGISPR